MNMLPVLARAFGVDPVAFERQVEAYENPDRPQDAAALDDAVRRNARLAVRMADAEAECRRLREALGDACRQIGRIVGDPEHWGKREIIARLSHVEMEINTALDAALTPPEAQGREVQAEAERKLLGAIHLVKLLKAAGHALRSYEYGNSDPAMAKNVADQIDAAFPGEPRATGPQGGAGEGNDA